MRIKRPKTVEAVMAPLQRAMGDLEEIKERQRERRAQLLDQIRSLEDDAKAAGTEAEKADDMIGRIRGLIG